MTTTSIFFERQTRAISDVGAEEVCVGIYFRERIFLILHVCARSMISDVVRGAEEVLMACKLPPSSFFMFLSSCSCVIVHIRYYLSNYLWQMKKKKEMS